MNISQYRTSIAIDYRKVCSTVMILMYISGTIGLLLPVTQPYFKLLSAFNLWVSLLLLLFFHQDFNKSFIIISLLIFFCGFFVEVLGVHTGIIFGQYWYGHTLGTKLLGVPLVIGANWLLLVYCSSVVTQTSTKIISRKLLQKSVDTPTWLKALFSATLMVILDLLIEPVAIRLDFWHWYQEQIPAQNYQAWFLLSFLLSYLFLNGKFLRNNPLAPLLLLLQFLFFLIINLYFLFF